MTALRPCRECGATVRSDADRCGACDAMLPARRLSVPRIGLADQYVRDLAVIDPHTGGMRVHVRVDLEELVRRALAETPSDGPIDGPIDTDAGRH